MAAALRSLARGTWGPAASALRLRSCAGMSTAARSRLHGNTRNQAEQHKNGTREATEEERAFILNELDKAEDVLRQRDKEVEELKGEMNSVIKICAVSFVGLTALLFWK